MKNESPRMRPPTPRYEVLLEERMNAGRRLMQAVFHSHDASSEIPALWRAVQAAEQPLQRFRRWSYDYLSLVMPAEDTMWHDPRADPQDSCPWCVRSQLGLATIIALPSAARRNVDHDVRGAA